MNLINLITFFKRAQERYEKKIIQDEFTIIEVLKVLSII